MNWRPEGWNNPHSGKTPDLVFPQCCIMLEEGAFEDGADNMLETLRNMGTPTGRKYTAYAGERKGYLVLIPDDKEEE